MLIYDITCRVSVRGMDAASPHHVEVVVETELPAGDGDGPVSRRDDDMSCLRVREKVELAGGGGVSQTCHSRGNSTLIVTPPTGVCLIMPRLESGSLSADSRPVKA